MTLTTSGSDEYCPHCDNHFVIDAVTPKPALQVEGDDARLDSRYSPYALVARAHSAWAFASLMRLGLERC